MSPRVLKAEKDAIGSLLDQEWDDADELATAIIRALDDVRAEKRGYCLVTRVADDDGELRYYVVTGPWSTVGQMERASKAGDVALVTGASMQHRWAFHYYPGALARARERAVDPTRKKRKS
jgi:hypothetical protein